MHGVGLSIMIGWPQLLCIYQVWSHLAIWVSKSCISPRKILLDPEFIHTWSATFWLLCIASEAIDPRLYCCLPWCHHRVTWITWSPLWPSPHLSNSDTDVHGRPLHYLALANIFSKFKEMKTILPIFKLLFILVFPKHNFHNLSIYFYHVISGHGQCRSSTQHDAMMNDMLTKGKKNFEFPLYFFRLSCLRYFSMHYTLYIIWI